MRYSVLATIRLFTIGCIGVSLAGAAGPSRSELERKFTGTVLPFVTTYCVACHSGGSPAAALDLRQYTSMDVVVRDYPRWDLVLQKLSTRQMPPAAVPHPSNDKYQAVIKWIQAMRTNEARRTAGDPGPVLARRLSNAEYDNSIRDLTGVDLHPTREFPVDPANTAGFDNSGESLTMSSALLKKYLQAARDVADHMALTQDGFDFAPFPMLVETDREKYAIQRIISFYASHDTDFADYFQAAWRFKHRAELRKPNATLASVAAESKVSAKYLPMVWSILEEAPAAEKQEVGPIAKLQSMWHALPAPSADKPDALRAKCVEMREFAVRIRRDTGMQYAAPLVKGLPGASQPLLNWKLRNFNLHRRDFDPASLRNDSEPPMVAPPIPKYPGLHAEAAPRWEALTLKSRSTDPDLVVPAAQRARYEDSFARFAKVFPDAFYIKERGRYFPDDSQDKGRFLSAGYHNVMGYWRDDVPMSELILDEKGQKELESLWTEFEFIANFTGRTWVEYYFNESGEVDGHGAESGKLRPSDAEISAPPVIFGLRDTYLAKANANPVAQQAITYHFNLVNETLRKFEKMRIDAEPRHLEALVDFAARAYRRPLSQAEHDDLIAFYHSLRDKSGLNHEDAIRDSLIRVLMSPKFSYRVDLLDGSEVNVRSTHGTVRTVSTKPPKVKKLAGDSSISVEPLSNYDLASRLSYFLWSSMPDEELLASAKAGDLRKPEVLIAQARRMLKDARVNGLAKEFGGNWLDFRRFEDINSVDRERFPMFNNELREAMFQEPVHFLEDVIQNDRSVLDMLYANRTFVNPALAKHYGMPPVTGGPDTWIRVDNAHDYGRGGLLPMAAFLTQNAPGLRTSPVKRGYWVVRRVLGEVIPPPPPVVPELPHDEATSDLPVRELLAKHRENAVCAACHARFDSYGLAFEGYGPVGETRTKDLAGRAVDAQATFAGGVNADGFAGILTYIQQHRQKDFVENLSRKLLAFALERSLMLSDEPEIERMEQKLTASDYRFTPLVETVITSPQFLNRRRADAPQQKGD